LSRLLVRPMAVEKKILWEPLTRPLTEELGLFGLGEAKPWNVRIIDETSFELLPPIAIVEHERTLIRL
jgi:hypothetical protein